MQEEVHQAISSLLGDDPSHDSCTEEDHAPLTAHEICLLRRFLRAYTNEHSYGAEADLGSRDVGEAGVPLEDLLDRVLQECDTEELRKAAKVLSQYACVKHTKGRLLEHSHCTAALVRLLQSADQETQAAGLIAAKNLAADEKFSSDAEAELIEAAGALLDSVGHRRDVLHLLTRLRSSAMPEIFLASLMHPVLRCLSTRECTQWDAAVGTESDVEERSMASGNVRSVTSRRALEVISSVMQQATVDQRRDLCTKVVAHDGHRTADKICRIAGCSHQESLTAGAVVVAQLAAFDATRKQILKRNGEKWLLEALLYARVEEVPELLEAVARLSIAFSKDFRIEAASPSQLISKLMHLLGSPELVIQRNATIVLSHLARNEMYRDMILEKDTKRQFLGLLLEAADEGDTEIPSTLHDAFTKAYGPDALKFLPTEEEKEEKKRQACLSAEETPRGETTAEETEETEGVPKNWSTKLWNAESDDVVQEVAVMQDERKEEERESNSERREEEKDKNAQDTGKEREPRKSEKGKTERAEKAKEEERGRDKDRRRRRRDTDDKGDEKAEAAEKEKKDEKDYKATKDDTHAEEGESRRRRHRRRESPGGSSHGSPSTKRRTGSATSTRYRKKYRTVDGRRKSMKGISGGGWPAEPPKKDDSVLARIFKLKSKASQG